MKNEPPTRPYAPTTRQPRTGKALVAGCTHDHHARTASSSRESGQFGQWFDSLRFGLVPIDDTRHHFARAASLQPTLNACRRLPSRVLPPATLFFFFFFVFFSLSPIICSPFPIHHFPIFTSFDPELKSIWFLRKSSISC